MDKIDLIVIGGGPAGYLAAERAADAGMSVTLFEKKRLGGVCLNEGCVPTKTFLNSAKIYAHAKDGAAYGVSAENVKIDHSVVLSRKKSVVRTLVSGVEYKLKKSKVNVIYAEAVIRGKTDGCYVVSAEGADYAAKRLLLAPGSKPVVPPIPGVAEGIEGGWVMTSREILDMESIPRSIAIVGGGVIGLEMADYYATVGSNVIVIEMLNKIAGPFDSEISGILQKELESKGVTFLLGAKVTEIRKGFVKAEVSGSEIDVPAEVTLLSIGRRPSIENLGLETIHIHCEKGAVVTGRNMQTSAPGVYAAGDLNGKFPLAHTAYREAEVAVNHMSGVEDHMDYSAIPSVIYTQPEAAYVGETEDSAKAKGLKYKLKKLPLTYSGRYVAEHGRGSGICKIIEDEKSGKIYGVSIIGAYASEIILSAGILVDLGIPEAAAKRVVFPHPTVSEIIRETLFT